MAISLFRLLLVLLILVCCVFPISQVNAQSAEVVPEGLRRLPIGDLGVGLYWQQVRVRFGAADAASDSTIRLVMPHNVEIRDTDGDADLTDEIRLVYDPSSIEQPGFFVSQATVAEMIVIGSSQKTAANGELYIQFPIHFGATTEVGELTYGAVLFDDPTETDLVPGPMLTIIDPDDFADLASTNLVGFGSFFAPGADTSTSALGTLHPDLAGVVATGLPDMVFDNGTGNANNLLGFGDGDDSNDVEYRFFFSTSANLVAVTDSMVVEALLEDGTAYLENEGEGRAVRFLTRDLPIGTHYLYVTSSITGSVPLGRSRGLTVRHEPQVDLIGPDVSDITLDSGGLLDLTGNPTGAGTSAGNLNFAVTDHDDTSEVFLFYSSDPDLGADGVQGGPANISGLKGAEPIVVAQGIRQKEGLVQWDVVDPVLVAAGDYYIYAVTTDASQFQVGRSSKKVAVRHSPFLRLDVLNDQVLSGADTIVTGGLHPQQFVSITWGRSGRDGDRDVDDNAQISLYYSTLPATANRNAVDSLVVPGGAEALRVHLGTTVHQIAQGVMENPDLRTDNMFVWDVWSTVDEMPPRVAETYYVYGIIDDGTSTLLVQLNGGRLNDAGSRLRFEHPPSLRMLHPIADIEIDASRSARVSWEDMDVDDNARIRVILSQEDYGQVADYASILNGTAFVINSEDGTATADTAAADLHEDVEEDFFDVGVKHIADISLDTSYFAYVAITETGSFDSSTLACRSQGKIGIRSASPDEVVDSVFQLLPGVFTLGNNSMSQTFEIRVNAGGQAVDLVQLRLSLDGNLFEASDSGDVEGIQPFQVAPGFSDARVFVNEGTMGEDGKLLLDFTYFDPISPQIEGLDGETTVATFQLVSREEVGPISLQLDADPLTGRVSVLENDRVQVVTPVAREIAQGLLVSSGGVLRGRVALEGRADQTALADVALREVGSYLSIENDQLAENDVDPERQGIQLPLQADGSFELLQVPAGRFDLNLHVDGFLDGWVPNLRLAPGQELDDLRPSSYGMPTDSLMLGGDVAGYFDVDGISKPDNEITLSDWDFVASLYKREIAPEADSMRADINANGTVDINDLTMIGKNFRKRGPRPVYKRASNLPAIVRLDRLSPGKAHTTGDHVDWEVQANGFAGIQALEIELAFDPTHWEPQLLTPRWVGSDILATTRSTSDRFHVALVVKGRTSSMQLEGSILAVRLLRLNEEARDPTIRSVVALDQQYQSIPVENRSQTETSLPAHFSLDQNYPNPFNPETTIAFSVGPEHQGDIVKLEIFDILGQRVNVVWKGALESGTYKMKWDGRDRSGREVGSGVYLYRLQRGREQLIKRMVLVR